MKFQITTFLLLFYIQAFSQQNELFGTYSSVKNKLERLSEMSINADETFIYRYAVSGCQAEVTGAYQVTSNRIKFVNVEEYTETYLSKQDWSIQADTVIFDLGPPFYPDLSKSDWKVGKNYIKPMQLVDSGCLPVYLPLAWQVG